MNYIYVSKTCSDQEFKRIYDQSVVKPQQQDQKFHKLLIDGLIENQASVDVISSRPINRNNLSRVFFGRKLEKSEKLSYHYLSFINLKWLRQLTLWVSLMCVLALKFLKKRKETIVLCDILNTSLSLGVIMMTRLFGIKRIAIVTDIPDELDDKSRLYRRFTTRFAKQYHGYIILSQYMNPVINPLSRPSILVEGMMKKSHFVSVQKEIPFTMLYTGGLAASSGIDTLLAAFDMIKEHHVRLWIAGHGALADTVRQYERNNPCIRYLGTLMNEEIMNIQKASHLLINPRPSHESQTKFSFPSKLMEYMASGTPTLSTRLLGIPDEYAPYLHWIDDESVEGFHRALLHILNTPYALLQEKAMLALEFVTQNKTNVHQAKRVMMWIHDHFSRKENKE